MKLTFTGRGRLLENDQFVYTGESFDVTEQRAEQLLADPHASVEIACSDYTHMTRDELNQLARSSGVSEPEALKNKQAVIDALLDPHPEAEADSGQGPTNQEETPHDAEH